jgi:hypothetical protein
MSMGELAGDFAAKFDSIGKLALTGAGDTPAMLRQS